MRPLRFKGLVFMTMLGLGPAILVGCQRHTASEADCLAILHRLVELELAESGYRDPEVHRRWKHEISRKLSSDLGRCQGRRVPDDLTACLNRARTPEEIAHGCLR